MRRLSPEEGPDAQGLNPNQPENDVGGAVGGAARQRDESALSFRHFLQNHSDVVPQPAPIRGRSSRGGVDLVADLALPDFVQDHLVLEALAAEPIQDLSPTRPMGHSLDHDILTEFGTSQRSAMRLPQSTSRRNNHEPPTSDAESPISHSSALPDFLSDGPMLLNNDASVNNSPSACTGSRGTRRPHSENFLPERDNRGPSFESKESLRLEIERLRLEVLEKDRRINNLESDLLRQRTVSTNLEASLRNAERNCLGTVERSSEAESNSASHVSNGHVDSHGAMNGNLIQSQGNPITFDLARSSEVLLRQLLNNMEQLKKISGEGEQSNVKVSMCKRQDKEYRPKKSPK